MSYAIWGVDSLCLLGSRPLLLSAGKRRSFNFFGIKGRSFFRVIAIESSAISLTLPPRHWPLSLRSSQVSLIIFGILVRRAPCSNQIILVLLLLEDVAQEGFSETRLRSKYLNLQVRPKPIQSFTFLPIHHRNYSRYSTRASPLGRWLTRQPRAWSVDFYSDSRMAQCVICSRTRK